MKTNIISFFVAVTLVLLGAGSDNACAKPPKAKAQTKKSPKCASKTYELKPPFAPQKTSVEFSVCPLEKKGAPAGRKTATLRIIGSKDGKASPGQTLTLKPCFGRTWEKLSVSVSRKGQALEVIGSSCTPAWCGYPERLRLKWTGSSVGFEQHYQSGRFWEACGRPGKKVVRVKKVKATPPAKPVKVAKPVKTEEPEDSDKKTLSANHKKFIGVWVIDFDQLIENNPPLKQTIDRNPERAEQMEKMFGSWLLTVTEDELTMVIFGKNNEATYTIESESENQISILSVDKESGKESTIQVNFNEDGGIVLSKDKGPPMKLYFKRKK